MNKINSPYNEYIDTLPRHVTTDIIQAKCDGKNDSACEECMICLKANADKGIENARQICFKICDRCDYCKMKNHNYSQTIDPPYWNRHPLTPDPRLQLYEGDVQRPLYDKNAKENGNRNKYKRLGDIDSEYVPYAPTKHPFFIPPKGSNQNIFKCSDPKVPMRVDSYRFHRSLTHPHSKFDVGSICGPNKKQEYEEQYYNYTNCRLCRESGMCWSRSQKKCVQCDPKQMSKSCERLYGCKQDPSVPSDLAQYVPPKNPLYTECRSCWPHF